MRGRNVAWLFPTIAFADERMASASCRSGRVRSAARKYESTLPSRRSGRSLLKVVATFSLVSGSTPSVASSAV